MTQINTWNQVASETTQDAHTGRPYRVRFKKSADNIKKTRNYHHGNFSLNNKPIIITFLAMEKVILLCTIKTRSEKNGSLHPIFSKKIFTSNNKLQSTSKPCTRLLVL